MWTLFLHLFLTNQQILYLCWNFWLLMMIIMHFFFFVIIITLVTKNKFMTSILFNAANSTWVSCNEMQGCIQEVADRGAQRVINFGALEQSSRMAPSTPPPTPPTINLAPVKFSFLEPLRGVPVSAWTAPYLSCWFIFFLSFFPFFSSFFSFSFPFLSFFFLFLAPL